MKKINIDKNAILIAYKLLHDALAIMLLAFSMLLIIEGIIPGLVSSHLSLAKVVLVIILNLGAILWIGRSFQITYDPPTIKKNKLLPVLVIGSFLLIGNSLLRFSLWENIIITLTTLLIIYHLYKMFFVSSDSKEI
jgi:hypothetical protein